MKWRPRPVAQKMWEVLITVTAIGLFVWQVGLNVQGFLARPTVFLVEYEPVSNFRLPPLTICPHPIFEPSLLKQLGVNMSGDFVDVEEKLSSLEGLDGNLRTSQLWQDAQWRLGQVVHMVMLSKGTINYKRNITEAPNWRRSYSPLGPCFTFLPPVGETNIKIGLHKLPYIEPCSWVDEKNQTVWYYGMHSQCETVQEKCNSTCGFEDYVFYRQSHFETAFIYFHTTSVYDVSRDDAETSTFEFPDLFFGGDYILKRLSYTPNLRSQTQQIETSLVKGDCVSSFSISRDCHLAQQKTQALRKLGCLPVQASTFEEPIGSTCSSPNLIQELFELDKELESCPQSCLRKRWEHVISDSWGPDFMIILEASSTDLRRETEVETYPLAQLFSDIGGSLGLFLGVSLIFVWDLIGRIMFIDKKKELCKAWNILKYTGVLLMCFATCVHGLQELKTFIFQPTLTSVSLGTPTSGTEDFSTALARRLSSRALDCRPKETPLIECQVQCVLDEAAKDVMSTIPFISVEDLPYCSHTGLRIPTYDYLVPSETLLVASSSEIVQSCTKSCYKLHSDVNTSAQLSYMHVNKSFQSYGAVRLICSLAGIIGLYLGISVFQAIDCYDCLSMFKNLSKEFAIHFKRFLKLIAIACCLMVLLLRCHGFFFNHQISSSITQTQAVPQVVTVCRWPPLSFTHLASYMGINLTEDTVLEMSKEQRLEVVLQLLDGLEGDWDGSLDVVWQAAAWNLSDVIGGYSVRFESGHYFDSICDTSSKCDAMWKPVITPLYRCFSMNMTFGNETFSEILLQFHSDVEKKDIFGLTPQIYYLLHPSGVPPLLTDMISKQPSMREIASVFSATYHPLEKTSSRRESLSYETCVQRCIGDNLLKLYECRLPYMEWRFDLPLCNQSQYSSIPRHFKGLQDVGHSFSRSKGDVLRPLRSLEDNCFVSCRHLRSTFYSIQKELVPSLYPSLTVRPQVETVQIQETDMYTFAQLVSDLGGIAGASVGFSLLLFKKGPSSGSCD